MGFKKICLNKQDHRLEPVDVALIVILYYPRLEDLAQIAQTMAPFEKVIIIDNTDSNCVAVYSLKHPNLQVVRNNHNIGLGAALNKGCEIAFKDGFDWCVTLDQDSALSPDYLARMREAIAKCPIDTAVLGCNYLNQANSTFRFANKDQQPLLESTTVITSGSLTYLPIWKQIGGFRSDYFIDSIDHEYCLRARSLSKHIFINLDVLMTHSIGECQRSGRNRIRITFQRHGTVRVYTKARNSMRTQIDYFAREPLWSIKNFGGTLFELLVLILTEPDKLQRLDAFFTGVFHGINGKLGPIPDRFKGKTSP